jgi:hypothetical protein
MGEAGATAVAEPEPKVADSGGSDPTRWRRSRILWTGAGFVAFLVLVVAVLIGHVLHNARAAAASLATAQSHAKTLRADMANGDFTDADQQLKAIQEATGQAHADTSGPVFTLATHVPVIGRSPAALVQVTNVAEDLSNQALPRLLEAAKDLDPASLRQSPSANRKGVSAAQLPLSLVAIRLDASVARLQSLNLAFTPAQVVTSVHAVRDSLLRSKSHIIQCGDALVLRWTPCQAR